MSTPTTKTPRGGAGSTPLPADELRRIDAYWRAANYLSVGQIYLYDNPLLKQPLTKEHVKPRLLGHWGTTPGLNFLYVHLNRVIKQHDLSMIYITGPGHGGPGLVANAYLEGTYSEVYPNISQDEEGLQRLFKQFSFPGGIPSHVAPETPGSIHEGGELGYALSHAYGAAFDNPDLIVACVVGDGEAETGPLATSWHSNKFLNPARDGAVLPILHLNGYKIANPTVLARISHEELDQLFRGYGYTPYFVEGHEPEQMHQLMAATLDTAIAEIQRIKAAAREKGVTERPRWPMIVLRSPKGWTCPKEIDGKRTEDYWRAHQVPMGEMHENPAHVQILEQWMKSYRPEELFDQTGKLVPELAALAPARRAPHERQSPRQRGAAAQGPAPARLPRLRRGGPQSGGDERRGHAGHGPVPPRRHEAEPGAAELPPLQPGREQLEPLAGRAGGHQPGLGRGPLRLRRSPGSRRPRDGGAQRAPVPGLARGLSPDRPPRLLLVLRGLHPHHRLDVQPARQVAEGHPAHPLAPAHRLAQLSPVEPRLAAGPQRLQPPGSRASSTTWSTRRPRWSGSTCRRTPTACSSVTDHCLRSRNYVNVVVAGKQPAPQWLTMDQAIKHCTAGIGIWPWASNDQGGEPDVVMACCGDVPTLETLAAVDLLRRHLPELKIRVINVVDLMKLQPQSEHPHGLSDRDFDVLFTTDRPVVFAFHGYPTLIHRLTYRRTNHQNIHVRGYVEEGTTTTPFDMCVLNRLDRFHLVGDVIDRVPTLGARAAYFKQAIHDALIEHRQYVVEHGEDRPEISGWQWGQQGGARAPGSSTEADNV